MDTDFELADRIEAAMEAAPAADWSPSQMARKVHAGLQPVRETLAWMADHQYVAAAGNGSRVRYTLRRP
jgi:hypothetical protein